MREIVGHPGEQQNQGQDLDATYARAKDTAPKTAPAKEEEDTRKRAKAKGKMTKVKAKERGRKEKAKECIRWMIGGDQERRIGVHR